jgi:hypothetical protein
MQNPVVVPLQGQQSCWSITGPASREPGDTSTTCLISANATSERGDVVLLYDCRVQVGLDQQGNPIYETVPTVKCKIKVDALFSVQLKLHFPSDTNRRTNRAAYPNLFANPTVQDDATRRTERNRLAVDLVFGPEDANHKRNFGVPQIWDQGCIDFYTPVVDNNPDEKIGEGTGIWNGNKLISDAPASGALIGLCTDTNVLNVFLVNDVSGGDSFAVAFASSDYDEKGNTPVFVLGDSVTPSTPVVIAHEFGHVMGLDHCDLAGNWMVDQGTINKLKGYYGDWKLHYVMNSGTANEKLLMEQETDKARYDLWTNSGKVLKVYDKD